MRAWFAGDFDACLALAERVRVRDVHMVSQLALLRARALIRLNRADEAIAVVNGAFVAHNALDASLTAQMLLGAAFIRRGEARRGLAMLRRAHRASVSAHPTIRSEIVYNIGLAQYAQRQLADADRWLEGVSTDADIVHARALDLRGWIAMARADYDAAMRWFASVLQRLDGCLHADRHLEANTLKILALLAAERLDRNGWLLAEQRAQRLDWSASGLGDARFAIAIAGSLIAEADGSCDEALRWSAEAQAAGRNEAAVLYAVCREAAILRGIGERFAHRHVVRRIRSRVDALDDASLREDDDRQVLMAAAQEVAAVGEVDHARALLQRYDALPPLGTLQALAVDPRGPAFRAFLDAAIADAANDVRAAHDGYVEALRVFRRIGYHRRAVLAALRLGEITGQPYLFDYVDSTVRRLAPGSPLRARAQRRDGRPFDPVVAALSRTERAVLELLLEGQSTARIAEARNRSKQTIRNTVSRLLTLFQVPDRQALLRECVRRGQITPEAGGR